MDAVEELEGRLAAVLAVSDGLRAAILACTPASAGPPRKRPNDASLAALVAVIDGAQPPVDAYYQRVCATPPRREQWDEDWIDTQNARMSTWRPFIRWLQEFTPELNRCAKELSRELGERAHEGRDERQLIAFAAQAARVAAFAEDVDRCRLESLYRLTNVSREAMGALCVVA